MVKIIFRIRIKLRTSEVKARDKKFLPVKRRKGTTKARVMVSRAPAQGNPLNQASTLDGSMRVTAKVVKDQNVHTPEGKNIFEFFLRSKKVFIYEGVNLVRVSYRPSDSAQSLLSGKRLIMTSSSISKNMFNF
jgi:hypothetical protein